MLDSGKSAAVQPRQSQVEEELMVLHNSCNSLAENINTLIERLDSVLRNELSNKPEQADKENALVPVAERIRQSRYCVQENSCKINDILSRLEL